MSVWRIAKPWWILTDKKAELDEDSQRRLTTNPLRILDSKDANTQKILENAPKLADFLGEKVMPTLIRFKRI